jgi:hypothetical protein
VSTVTCDGEGSVDASAGSDGGGAATGLVGVVATVAVAKGLGDEVTRLVDGVVMGLGDAVVTCGEVTGHDGAAATDAGVSAVDAADSRDVGRGLDRGLDHHL